MEIVTSKSFPEKKFRETLKTALEKLKLSRNVKKIYLKIDDSLGKDANVNYEKIGEGKLILSFGPRVNINKKLIYHELAHVYDAIFNKIIFDKKIFRERKVIQELMGLILNLSVDGRLEKMKLPHFSKSERLKDVVKLFKKRKLSLNAREFIDQTWGKKYTNSEEVKQETLKFYKKLKRKKTK